MRGDLRRWRDEEGDGAPLGALRVALGVLLLLGAARAAFELEGGYFGDFFHWPALPSSVVASRDAYAGLVACQAVLALAVVTGRWARPALALSGLSLLYVLACDRLQLHHNRYALALYALLLSLTPCDRSLRLGRPLPPRGPLWGARLLGAQVSVVYLASAGSKLFDPDWRGGLVILERLRLYGDQAVRAGVPAALVEALAHEAPASVLAKLAIATELGVALGLWSRWRPWAMWAGVWFHGLIEVTSRVEGFSWLAISSYAVFATYDRRARAVTVDDSRPAGRAIGAAVRGLDWLLRFEVTGAPGPLVGVTGRDGVRRTGAAAFVALARGLPLLFAAWGPLFVLSRARRQSSTLSE